MSLISHSQKHSKIHKKRLDQDQVKLLESCFDASKKLEPDRKFELARELGVPPRQIAIWYQNKRARWKNQSLELDYNAMQVKLETALAEKKRLEQEVDSLKSDLKRARDALASFRSQATTQGRVVLRVQEQYACASNVPQFSSLSSCCDESSLNDDVGCSGNNSNNIINSCNNNSGNNVINMNNDNWGDDHVRASLQFEELYACLMLGPKGSSSCGQVTATDDERDFWA